MRLFALGARRIRMMRFSICSWAVWSVDAAGSVQKPLSVGLRRRVTPLGRKALEIAGSLPSSDMARYVFSSRHGEFSRTLAILRAIAANEAVSPTDFSMSVHHALTGILSIQQGSHAGHTALAAGAESFCFAMMEAAAALVDAPQQPVMVVHYDEPLPDEYSVFESQPRAAVLALLLTTGDMFSLSQTVNAGSPPDTAPAAQVFRQFLEGGQVAGCYVAEARQWHWERHGGG